MKRIAFSLIIFLLVFMVGCIDVSFDINHFNQQQTTSTTYSVSDGTIAYDNADYHQFSTFDSENEGLDTLDEITDVLIQTQTEIRLSNVKIETIIYSFPGVNTQSGSAVIFSEDNNYYYIVTNRHVIESNKRSVEYEVHIPSSDSAYTAVLIAENEDLDLAALRFEKTDNMDLTVMDLTSRLHTKYNPGELVLTVGNPGELENNVTYGEFIEMIGLESYDHHVIHHSAAIHSGSSGGALVDVYGNFLGINTWGSDSSYEDSFAIPSYIVYMFLFNNGLM